MATADRYRAFARECMRWADRAQTTERSEILLNLAMSWAEAAALLDNRHRLIGQFNELTKRSLRAALGASAWNGTGQIIHADGSGQAGLSVSVSDAKDQHQLPRETGETAAE